MELHVHLSAISSDLNLVYKLSSTSNQKQSRERLTLPAGFTTHLPVKTLCTVKSRQHSVDGPCSRTSVHTTREHRPSLQVGQEKPQILAPKISGVKFDAV